MAGNLIALLGLYCDAMRWAEGGEIVQSGEY